MSRTPRELRPHESAQAFFGAELRHWRNLRKYSQDELGGLTLNSGDTIGKVEKATRWPTEQLAQRCDMVLDTGGVLKRILPLVLAERRMSTTAAEVQPPGRGRRPHLPPVDVGSVKRTDVQDVVVESLLAATEVVAPAPVVIGGPGGFGKTVLALQVCRDERLAGCFDVILWAETGQDCTPARIAALVSDLCEQLHGQRPAIATPEQAGFHLAEALGERRVLLVIDNVWATTDVAPMLLGGPNAVRLITTRNLGVCRARSRAFRLAPMSDDEIGRILDSAAVLPLAELHTRQLALACAGWPLLASVVGASVAADIAAGATGEAAIKRAAAALRDDGPQALDVWDADQREGTIGRAVASSLRNLDDHVAVHGGTALGDRYLDLAIFPPAALIPLAVLGHWWQREHGWTMTGVRQFARVLAERSLLGSYLADEDAVVLHDVFRSCLLYLARRPIVDAHKSLIDSFRTRSPGGWAQLPTDQPYLWRFLTHHLDQADYPEEVISVLADPAFVVAKVNYFGHEPMAEDSLALTSAASRIEPTGEAAVARTLVDATYLAADATSTSDIGATLRAALAWAGQLRSPAADTLRTWTADAFNVRWAAPGASDGSGHTGAVTSVAAAGDCVVSGGEDGSVRIWDRASRRLRRVLRGHHGWVYAVTISPSGEFAASAGDDAIIRLWTVTSGKLIGILTGHTKRIRGLAFDASGARLLSGGEDGSIIVWSIDPAARVRDLATDGRPIWSVAIGHRDQLVAAGGEDENVRIFNLDTGQLVAERSGHQDWVRAVAFAADSPLLASGSGDGTVKLWNVADGHLAMLRSTPVGSRVRALTVSPDAGTIQAADENPMVSRITADGVVQTIAMPAGVDWIRAIAAINRDDNEDGGVDESVLGCEDGAIRLLRNGNVVDLAPGRDTVWSTAFTPDMQAVLLGRSDGIIEVNGALANVRRQHIAAGEGRVWALDTAAGYIAAACGDGAVRAWNLDEGSWSMELGQDGPRAWAVAVHPAGSALAASSGHGLLQLWDLPSGRLRWRCEAHAGRVRTVAFDPTGATLTTGGGDGFVRIWDTATGQRVSEVRGSAGWVRTVGVDDSAKRVIVGLGSGDVSVHDTTRAEPPVHLFGHGGRVLAAHFVGDDELVTAAADGTVRLWSLSAQRQRAQVRLDASLQCAYVDRYTGSVLASSSAGVIALDLRRTAKET